MPLSLKSCRNSIELFLHDNGLRLDDVDYYAVVKRLGEDTILAGGGLCNDIIKCVAVDDSLRGTGMSQRLVSHLFSVAQQRGYLNVKVFTKPSNVDIFTSLSFRQLASAPQAVLLENGIGGLDDYKNYLEGCKRDGRNGVIVMNCNPFTTGHRYLVEKASSLVDNLYVIVVKEDVSLFSYDERIAIARNVCKDYNNVIVCDGSDYSISQTTFPTYFLKQLSDASDTQMTLDIDLFACHIAPSLGATLRFVGTEPTDRLTHRYNELMKMKLKKHDIEVIEIERYAKNEVIVSASNVRNMLKKERLCDATQCVPSATLPYLVAKMATLSLEKELKTTPKPGLVDTHDCGSHCDMDYNTMSRSIKALSPFFVKLAVLGFSETLPSATLVQHMGVEAEKAMLAATNGVNTHRGALFSMGLAIVGATHALHCNTQWVDAVKTIALNIPENKASNGAVAIKRYNVKGALAMACEGYEQLNKVWLEYYRNALNNECAEVKTLLLIMSQLDDTNVIHRVGYQRAQQVKKDAQLVLDNFSIKAVEALNREFIAENISPGGAADMLALTFFVNAITQNQIN